MADDDFEARDTRDPDETDRERELLIAAFSKAASEHGYRSLTVDQVARSAGLSRTRFEHHFGSMEQGLMAAQDVFLDRIWLEVVGACQAPTDWPERVRSALGSAIAAVTEASSLARVFAVEGSTASLAALERQFAMIDQFASLLGEGRNLYPRAASLPASTEQALIGGIFSILSGHLLAEDPGAISAVEAELVELLLTPYIGEGEAKRISAV